MYWGDGKDNGNLVVGGLCGVLMCLYLCFYVGVVFSVCSVCVYFFVRCCVIVLGRYVRCVGLWLLVMLVSLIFNVSGLVWMVV